MPSNVCGSHIADEVGQCGDFPLSSCALRYTYTYT